MAAKTTARPGPSPLGADRSSAIRSAGRLAGDGLGLAVDLVEGVHRGVARRAFGSVGPAALPARAAHDAISGAVYGVVRLAHRAAPRAAAAALSLAGRPAAGWEEGPAARTVLAAVNGMWGDTLERRYGPLAPGMSLRACGAPVALDRAGLAAAWPGAGPRLAVFVHGLCETDQAWRRGGAAQSFGARLEADCGYTPLYVAYNTGLHVSDNGRSLCRLLAAVMASWPVPVEGIVLVGHSMGGLVARSACHYGHAQGEAWTGAVTHVLSLGTPHLGAPLEKCANAAAWLLGAFPETAPFARALNSRSAGIKDLRFGSCVEEEWSGGDPDELLRDHCGEVTPLPRAAYHNLAATVTRVAAHPLGAAVGDLLVRLPSASGAARAQRIQVGGGPAGHVGGINHLDLLDHPAVYDQLRRWLTGPEL